MCADRPPRGNYAAHVALDSDSPGDSTLANEQVLLRLLTQVQHLNERVLRLEELADRGFQADPSTPSQEDLLEVQLHSARVAAELSRVTVELRAEIATAAQGGVATASQGAAGDEPDSADDAEVIDLTANHPAARRRSSGWVPDSAPTRRPLT